MPKFLLGMTIGPTAAVSLCTKSMERQFLKLNAVFE